jgi:ABC-2 type transport system permease protein
VPIIGFMFFPNTMWLVLIIWVAPAIAGLGLGVMVLLSSRVNTFQEAYQLGSMVVLPVVLLMLGQISGVLFFSTGFVIAIGLILWVIDIALLWASIRGFTRSQLLERL